MLAVLIHYINSFHCTSVAFSYVQMATIQNVMHLVLLPFYRCTL